MKGWPSHWRPFRRIRNRAAWNGSPSPAAARGAGRPAGLHACGRAILAAQDCDDKWAQACRSWDELRTDIRRIADDGAQAQAWQLAAQALRDLQDDVRIRFHPDEEVHPHVDH